MIDYKGFVFKSLNILYSETEKKDFCPKCNSRMKVYEFEYPNKIYLGVIFLSILPTIWIGTIIIDKILILTSFGINFISIIGLITWTLSMIFLIIFIGIALEEFHLQSRIKELLKDS
jgi:hypothetical protein